MTASQRQRQRQRQQHGNCVVYETSLRLQCQSASVQLPPLAGWLLTRPGSSATPSTLRGRGLRLPPPAPPMPASELLLLLLLLLLPLLLFILPPSLLLLPASSSKYEGEAASAARSHGPTGRGRLGEASALHVRCRACRGGKGRTAPGTADWRRWSGRLSTSRAAAASAAKEQLACAVVIFEWRRRLHSSAS